MTATLDQAPGTSTGARPTIDVLTVDLVNALKTALAFAGGTDKNTPGVLRTVGLFCPGNGYLGAVATDRFKAGVARIPAEVSRWADLPDSPLLLTVNDVKRVLLPALGKVDRAAQAWHRTTITLVSAGTAPLVEFRTALGVSVRLVCSPDEFPRIGRIMRDFQQLSECENATPVATFAIDPKHLAAFAVAASWGERPGRILISHGAGKNKPMRITAGDHFIGLLMPVYANDDDVAYRDAVIGWFADGASLR